MALKEGTLVCSRPACAEHYTCLVTGSSIIMKAMQVEMGVEIAAEHLWHIFTTLNVHDYNPIEALRLTHYTYMDPYSYSKRVSLTHPDSWKPGCYFRVHCGVGKDDKVWAHCKLF